MGLIIKNFDIMGVHLKIRIHSPCMKKQFFGLNRLKRGAWIVCRFKRGLGKKEKKKGWCLWGGRGWQGWDPNAHYELEEPSYWQKYPKQKTL